MDEGETHRVVGRDREAEVLAAALASSMRGVGAAIAVTGPPGSGKSLLLSNAARLAADGGMRVLRVSGVESESPLAFSALHRLLRHLRVALDSLPARQAQALRAALGEANLDVEMDRFAVYLAVLTLLSDAAAEAPVLVLVDDAHWLDEASREALLFVARRVDGERIAFFLSLRDDTDLDVTGLPTLPLRGLEPVAAQALLSSTVGLDVPALVAEELCARTLGNPLALIELARSLDHAVLSGRQTMPAVLPLTAGVEAAFLDRFRSAEPGVRTVLLVAATDDSGDLALVTAAARRLGAAEDAVRGAERSGLLTSHADTVEFRHPLVRSAIYGGAPPGERRAAHAALAESLPDAIHADRRAWHLAASVENPDESVVAELDSVARRALAVGGYEAASAAWARAAELSSDAASRGTRLLDAARAAWTAGRPQRAGLLAENALVVIDEPGARADAELLRARVEWSTGSVASANHRLLREAAAVLDHDPAKARTLAMFAASLGVTSKVDSDEDPLAFVGDPHSPTERCTADLLRAFAYIARHQWGEAGLAVHGAEVAAAEVELGLEDLLPNLGLAALHLALDDVALRLHERLLTRSRERGALIMVLYALTRRAAVDVPLGRWNDVAAGAHEAQALAAATGRPGLAAMPLAWTALISALRGDDEAPSHLAALERGIAEGPMGTTEDSVRDQVLWTRALLAPTPADALHHYRRMTHGFAERMVALNRIEVAVRAGREDLATEWIAALDEFAAGTRSPWACAVVEHGRALLAGDEAGPHFTRALEFHANSPRRVDAAHTHLAYGEWLRRRRRRVDARSHLREAMQVFDDLGARGLANRAADELRASGERARRRDIAEAVGLTPTERTVARLVAQGLATRDVAAQLFVSPRTVDFHLRNVFAKVGVTSRAALAHVALD